MHVDKVLPSSSAKYFVLSPAHILTYMDKMEKMEEKKCVTHLNIIITSVCMIVCWH